jgi:hypothetical protein
VSTKHHVAERPRIAILDANAVRAAALEQSLPGDVRVSPDWASYLTKYSPEETDIVIAFDNANAQLLFTLAGLGERYLLTIGDRDIAQSPLDRSFGWHRTKQQERELNANYNALDGFFEPATRQLVDAIGGDAPSIVDTEIGRSTSFVSTDSGMYVAVYYAASGLVGAGGIGTVDVFSLPGQADPAIWALAMLRWINSKSPSVVPSPPARLVAAHEWYTPDEQQTADRIVGLNGEISRLQAERDGHEQMLRTSLDSPPAGAKRLLTSDGDDLVEATAEVLSELGFVVRDMDAELQDDQPKREDLRVTIPSDDRWVALVEVKGYGKGAKTNDLRQIRNQRDNFISETGEPPDATWWVMNENRQISDPSLRPALGADVDAQSTLVETTVIRTTDLFQLWRQVVSGSVSQDDAILWLTGLKAGAIHESLSP